MKSINNDVIANGVKHDCRQVGNLKEQEIAALALAMTDCMRILGANEDVQLI